jgi:dienelactone hydrolase
MPQDLRKRARGSSGPDEEKTVEIPATAGVLHADLCVPAAAKGLVIFAHGSGSSRRSPRNRAVAQILQGEGLATLLLDLLTPEEDSDSSMRFDLDLMIPRLESATAWAGSQESTSTLAFGYFGASTGAAVALQAAAHLGPSIRAVVSRGGRPDLAGSALPRVKSPTLLIVGGLDRIVLDLNRQAFERLGCGDKELAVIPGATHLFEEEGAMEQVADRAAHWYRRHFGRHCESRA